MKILMNYFEHVVRTDTFVGLAEGGAGPGSVIVEGLAAFAVDAGRVVFALTRELSVGVDGAARGVPVTLAAAADGEVGERVVVALLRVDARLARVVVGVQAVERHPDVGGRHPVLQHGTVVEVVGRRTAFERAEGDARAAVRIDVAVGVRAEGFLLVRLGDLPARWAVVHFAALTGVVLEGDPRLAKVDAFVDGHRVWPHGAELQTDVGELVPFAQTQGERHVLRSSHYRLRDPAGQVVGIVQVR